MNETTETERNETVHRYALSGHTKRCLDAAAVALLTEAREHRRALDARSVFFREGEAGIELGEWIDMLGGLAESLHHADTPE